MVIWKNVITFAVRPMLAEHIRINFNDYGGDMNRLYCELDKSNGNKLLEWVMDNYNSERKLFG